MWLPENLEVFKPSILSLLIEKEGCLVFGFFLLSSHKHMKGGEQGDSVAGT